jgi:hypothetical protein
MDYVGNVGNFLEQLETKYKLPPVLPEAVALQNVMGPAAKQATKQAAKAAKPVVGKALEEYMFKQGLALPATVYHGSPHKFDKFDASKIGTGEGVQAYGHGLYFAESPAVAREYQTKLSSTDGAKNLASKYGGVDGGIAEATRRIENYKQLIANGGGGDLRRANSMLAISEKNLADLTAMKAGLPENTGAFYKVDLPDEKIAKMLDWDKPLSQQHPDVQAALLSSKDKTIVNAINDIPVAVNGGEYWKYRGNTYASKAEALDDATGMEITSGRTGLGNTPSEVSARLKELGIPGIRYLDADSRAAGKGTSNFVVFPGEEDALTILERNQQPIKKESTRIADNPDTMMMEVEDQKFVGGGIAKAAKTAAKSAVATRELEKQAVLRAEAAAKSAAKQALMPQYNEAVKGMTQKQKPLSFEQWKAINYPEGTQGLQNAPQKQTFKYPQEEAMRLAQQRAALPIEQGGLGLPANNTPEMRAEAMGAVDWLHGTERLDRLLEKKNLDPRKSTSGPMPYGTNAGELASNYAMNKADTSLSAIDTGEMPNYFQVFPKSMGQRGSSPRSVESVWYSLPQEKKAEILEKAKRVGYENFDEATGPLTLHPEGVNAMNVAEDTWNYYLNRESKGNPLAALRAIWGESGTLFGQEEKLADIYKLAGFPYEISQTNAPWTTAKGVMTGKAMISNPLNTSNTVEIQEKVIPFLKEQFKNDRTRKKDFGADQWDKNFRYTPKEWISTLEDDIAAGNNSYVWTSIPDKVTQSLKKAGYNGIIDKSGKGGGVQEDVIIPFEPEQLRSRFAAFDPFRKTAATAAAMGVAAPDLLAEENKANGGSVNLDAMYMAVNDAKFRRK